MAWSLNGRFLAPFVGFGGELTPGVSAITQARDGSYLLAPRDAGLLIAASQLKSSSDPYATSIPVAWRADGDVIAALRPDALIDQIKQTISNDIPGASEHVDIYDCVTGKKRLTLTTKPLANRLQMATILLPLVLRWSPTGQKLMLLDTSFDSLTIWDVALK